MDATATGSRAPQHMRALERANEVRLARAQLKRCIASGEVGAADVVLDCPPEADSMKLCELLMSQRRWGRTRCRKVLQSIGLGENKTVGTLTQRQRITLAAIVAEKAAAARAAAKRNGGSAAKRGSGPSRNGAEPSRNGATPSLDAIARKASRSNGAGKQHGRRKGSGPAGSGRLELAKA